MDTEHVDSGVILEDWVKLWVDLVECDWEPEALGKNGISLGDDFAREKLLVVLNELAECLAGLGSLQDLAGKHVADDVDKSLIGKVEKLSCPASRGLGSLLLKFPLHSLSLF